MYPGILAAHGVGMALVVGLNIALSLRVLGVAAELPLRGMTTFYPVMWLALLLNVVTGGLLAMAAATRVFVDPVFWSKMLFVALATWNMWRLKRALLSQPLSLTAAGVPETPAAPRVAASGRLRSIALASFLLWGMAITLGRLMGYTFFRFWQ